MLVFWLLGFFPIVLLLTWALTFYLTILEAREQRLDWRRTLWWVQLVFFFHFPAYLALRLWVVYRRRTAA